MSSIVLAVPRVLSEPDDIIHGLWDMFEPFQISRFVLFKYAELFFHSIEIIGP